MWTENSIFKEDLQRIAACSFLPWEKLQDKAVLVTGATGLIGYNIIAALAYADLQKDLNLKIIALVRDERAALEKFGAILAEYPGLVLCVGTVEELPEFDEDIDYFIHAASPTSSAYFVEHPVETIQTAVCGTMNVLGLARKNRTEGFVYLSSMEVYGSPKEEKRLAESETGFMDPLLVRNSYPESKRMCESLVCSYVSEYGVPAKIVRLAQTFGPGVSLEKDTRVFAEFARCMMRNEDIVLLTEGKSKRGYLYTADAVTAILAVLLKGQPGEACNAMNEETYCSITEMAEMVAEDLCNGDIQVKISIDETAGRKFSPLHYYLLNTDKLAGTGWKPAVNLAEMYLRMTKARQEEAGSRRDG